MVRGFSLEAIILAGGFGTRLQSVVKDVPKPMADINGKPFLEYLLVFLAKNGCKKVILSVGYKKESIIDFFKDSYLDMQVVYSVEDAPLGTGGAIRKAISLVDKDDVLVLNGDTFFLLDIAKMYEAHKKNGSKITMALKPMVDFDRYGSVSVDGDTIVSFEEKGFKKEGLINAGAYLINRVLFQNLNELCDIFSFEKDFLEKYITTVKPTAFVQSGYFIDIGIPEDYEKAKETLDDYFKNPS